MILRLTFKDKHLDLIEQQTESNFSGLLILILLSDSGIESILKSVNLQFNTVGRRDDDMIVPLTDGPMIIWIDWE